MIELITTECKQKMITLKAYEIKPFILLSNQYVFFKKRGVIKLNRMGGRKVVISKLMPEV